MSKAFEITLELPETYRVMAGKTGRYNDVPLAKLPKHIIVAGCIAGFEKALNDLSRANIKTEDNPKPTLDDLIAARQRKIDEAWLNGDWSLKGGGGARGLTIGGAMLEVFAEQQKTERGWTLNETKTNMRKLVSLVFGEDEAATFTKYLQAAATVTARKANPKATQEEIEEIFRERHEHWAKLGREFKEALAETAKEHAANEPDADEMAAIAAAM